MKTIYYSELLNKKFETEEDCLAAEQEYNEAKTKKEAAEQALKAEKSARAKEIEDAYKAYREAENKYFELRNNFVKDYGQFHMTVREEQPIHSISDLFDLLFN